MPYKYSNSLEKLTLEMEDLRLRSSNHKVKIVRNIGKAESLVFFEQMFLATANWYARLPDFTSLDLRVKVWYSVFKFRANKVCNFPAGNTKIHVDALDSTEQAS